MWLNKRSAAFALCLALLAPIFPARADYVPTNRDTRFGGEKMTFEAPSLDAYTLLYESGTCSFWFRDDRDVIAVVDSRTGYTWKTGLDAGFSDDIKKAVKAAKTPEEKAKAAEPLEKNLNARYTAIANSILTAEYYEAETVKYISSASEKGASSVLSALQEPGHFVLDVDLRELDLRVKVYITFSEASIHYDIPFEEITGAGLSRLAALWITPFLGASGGMAEFFDQQTGDYGGARKKYAVPGYVLLPDGSGSLVRFQDNSVSFTEYVGDVYGPDAATASYNYRMLTDAVEVKSPVIPVYGIAHGADQAAFVAYAQKGAEHMNIIVRPEENLRINYTWAYPRFEYNSIFFKVYNRYGDGYFTLMSKPYAFDASMTYTFLAGEDANYSGMARTYRRHLMETGVLTVREAAAGDIPLRLDFIMSDVKKGLVGNEQVVVTRVGDARQILQEVMDSGITNVSSGLIGWQRGSETLAKPDQFQFTSAIGSQKDFERLMGDFASLGVDISFSRDFALVNELMVRMNGTAAQHLSTWFAFLNYGPLYPNAPINFFFLAMPEVSARWLKTLSEKAAPISQSITVTGISNTLVSTHNRFGPVMNVSEAIALYRDTMAVVAARLKVNMDTPNLYLWAYMDRCLNMPVTGSQYVFETDTVPFLQMVLHGCVQMYGPYANFSFYTPSDVLRMIDYNVSPAFILSQKPSYLLSDTLSSDMYSTEFAQYKELIGDIYAKVNAALMPLQGWEWVGRTMLKEGVACNAYARDGQMKYVLINYTEDAVTFMGQNVAALDYAVTKAEGGNAQ